MKKRKTIHEILLEEYPEKYKKMIDDARTAALTELQKYPKDVNSIHVPAIMLLEKEYPYPKITYVMFTFDRNGEKL